jgi:hypothetical protein
MFDVCTTGDTEHIDTIFKFLSHTRQHACIDILKAWIIPAVKNIEEHYETSCIYITLHGRFIVLILSPILY